MASKNVSNPNTQHIPGLTLSVFVTGLSGENITFLTFQHCCAYGFVKRRTPNKILSGTHKLTILSSDLICLRSDHVMHKANWCVSSLNMNAVTSKITSIYMLGLCQTMNKVKKNPTELETILSTVPWCFLGLITGSQNRNWSETTPQQNACVSNGYTRFVRCWILDLNEPVLRDWVGPVPIFTYVHQNW